MCASDLSVSVASISASASGGRSGTRSLSACTAIWIKALRGIEWPNDLLSTATTSSHLMHGVTEEATMLLLAPITTSPTTCPISMDCWMS